MPEECRNIYKNARSAAGITQNLAAEKLGISIESVRAYETGQRIPPKHIVLKMSVKYNDLYLCYDHMRITDEIFAKVVPLTPTATDLTHAFHQAQVHLSHIQTGVGARLAEIVADDVVDDSEWADFVKALEAFQGVAKGFIEMTALAMAQGPVRRNREDG